MSEVRSQNGDHRKSTGPQIINEYNTGLQNIAEERSWADYHGNASADFYFNVGEVSQNDSQ